MRVLKVGLNAVSKMVINSTIIFSSGVSRGVVLLRVLNEFIHKKKIIKIARLTFLFDHQCLAFRTTFLRYKIYFYLFLEYFISFSYRNFNKKILISAYNYTTIWMSNLKNQSKFDRYYKFITQTLDGQYKRSFGPL